MIMGRKKLFIMFSVILIAILLSSVFGVETFKPKYGLTTSNVNLRISPSGSIIKTVKKNTSIKMVGLDSNFYIVQLGSNEIGYISKSYVKENNKAPSGAKSYTRYSPYTAYINANSVNLRRGPSTSFPKVTSLSKNTKVTVIGKIDNFNVVTTSNKKVGCIRSDFLSKQIGEVSSSNPPNQTNISNRDLVIKLINDARILKGLRPYTINSKLNEISLLKSNEMVSKNYFLHTSPTYGTPFKMMQNFGITYKSAGENIAGNDTMKNVVNNWIASSSHSSNIFSSSFTDIGVGVTKSDKYGYIVVAMFIQK